MVHSWYFWFVLLFFTIVENFSCPIWAGPRRIPHSASYEVPERPVGEVDEQWPLAQWGGEERRVRRRDSDLIPLDLEVFRRENLGPKPVWKDPQNHQAPQKRKHDQDDIDEE